MLVVHVHIQVPARPRLVDPAAHELVIRQQSRQKMHRIPAHACDLGKRRIITLAPA